MTDMLITLGMFLVVGAVGAIACELWTKYDERHQEESSGYIDPAAPRMVAPASNAQQAKGLSGVTGAADSRACASRVIASEFTGSTRLTLVVKK